MEDTLQLREPDPIADWGDYEDSTGGPRLKVPAGRYTFTLPTVLPTGPEWGATKDGYLSLTITPAIAEGPFKGEAYKFSRFSLAPYKKRKATSLGDLLRALAYTGAPPQTNADYKNVIASLAGRSFESDTDAEYYCKGCRQTLIKNERTAPKDPETGEAVSAVGCPNCTDPQTGEALTVWRNQRLTFTVSAFRPKG